MITTTDKPAVDKAEEVSLVMALGKLVGLVNSYGPPADDGIHEGFVNVFGQQAFEAEASFRKTSDFVKLKEDLWYARCFAKDFNKLLREGLPSEMREVDDGKHTVGLSYGEGCNMEGEYTYLHSFLASEVTWGWHHATAKGSWTDLHLDWEPVSTLEDIGAINAKLTVPLKRLGEVIHSPDFKGFENLGFDHKHK